MEPTTIATIFASVAALIASAITLFVYISDNKKQKKSKK